MADLTAKIKLVYDPGNAISGYQGDIRKIVEASKKVGSEQEKMLDSLTQAVAATFKPTSTDAFTKAVDKAKKSLEGLKKDLMSTKPKVFTKSMLSELGTDAPRMLKVVEDLGVRLAKSLRKPFTDQVNKVLGVAAEAFRQVDDKKFAAGMARANREMVKLSKTASLMKVDLEAVFAPRQRAVPLTDLLSSAERLRDSLAKVGGGKGLLKATGISELLGSEGAIQKSFRSLAALLSKPGAKIGRDFGKQFREEIVGTIDQAGQFLADAIGRGSKKGIATSRKEFEGLLRFYKASGLATEADIAAARKKWGADVIKEQIKEQSRLKAAARTAIPADVGRGDFSRIAEEAKISRAEAIQAGVDLTRSRDQFVEHLKVQDEGIQASADKVARSLIKLNDVYSSLTEKQKKAAKTTRPPEAVSLASRDVYQALVQYSKLGGELEPVLNRLRGNLTSLPDDVLSGITTGQRKIVETVRLGEKGLSDLLEQSRQRRIAELKSGVWGKVLRDQIIEQLGYAENLTKKQEAKVQQRLDRALAEETAKIERERYDPRLSIARLNEAEARRRQQLVADQLESERIAQTRFQQNKLERDVTIRRTSRNFAEAKAAQELTSRTVEEWGKWWKDQSAAVKRSISLAGGRKDRWSRGQDMLDLLDTAENTLLAELNKRAIDSIKSQGRAGKKKVTIPKKLADPLQQELLNLIQNPPSPVVKDIAQNYLGTLKKEFSGELAKKGIILDRETLAQIGDKLWTSISPQTGRPIMRRVKGLDSLIKQALKLNKPERLGKQVEEITFDILNEARKGFNATAKKADKISEEGYKRIAEKLGASRLRGGGELGRTAMAQAGFAANALQILTNKILSGTDIKPPTERDFEASGMSKKLTDFISTSLPRWVNKKTKQLVPGVQQRLVKDLDKILAPEKGGIYPQKEFVAKALKAGIRAIPEADIPRGLSLGKMLGNILNDLYEAKGKATQINKARADISRLMFSGEAIAKAGGLSEAQTNKAMIAAGQGASLSLLQAYTKGIKGSSFEKFLASAGTDKAVKKLVKDIFDTLQKQRADAVVAAAKEQKALAKSGGVRKEDFGIKSLAGGEYRSVGLKIVEALQSQLGKRGQISRELSKTLTQLTKDLLTLKPVAAWKPSDINKIIEGIFDTGAIKSKEQRSSVRRFFDKIFGPALKAAREEQKRIDKEVQKAAQGSWAKKKAPDLAEVGGTRDILEKRLRAASEQQGLSAVQTEKYVQNYLKAWDRRQKSLAKLEKETAPKRAEAALQVKQQERQKVLDKYLEGAKIDAALAKGMPNRISRISRQYRPEDLAKAAADLRKRQDTYDLYLSELRDNTRRGGRRARQKTAAPPPEKLFSPEETAILAADARSVQTLQRTFTAVKAGLAKRLRVVEAAIAIQETESKKAEELRAAAEEKRAARERRTQERLDRKTLSNSLKVERANAQAQERAQAILAAFKKQRDEDILAKSLNYEKQNIANQNRAKKIAADFAKGKQAPAVTPALAPDVIEKQTRGVKASVSKAKTDVINELDRAAKAVEGRTKKRGLKALSKPLPLPEPSEIEKQGTAVSRAIANAGKKTDEEIKKLNEGWARSTARRQGMVRKRTRPGDWGLPDPPDGPKIVKAIKASIDWGARELERWITRRRDTVMGGYGQRALVTDDERAAAKGAQTIKSSVSRTVKTVKAAVDWGARDIERWSTRAKKSVALPLPIPDEKASESAAKQAVTKTVKAVKAAINWGARDIQRWASRVKKETPIDALYAGMSPDAIRRIEAESERVARRREASAKRWAEISRRNAEQARIDREVELATDKKLQEQWEKSHARYLRRIQERQQARTEEARAAAAPIAATPISEGARKVFDERAARRAAEAEATRARQARITELAVNGIAEAELRVAQATEKSLRTARQQEIIEANRIQQKTAALRLVQAEAAAAQKAANQAAANARQLAIGKALAAEINNLDGRLNQLSYRFQHVSWQMGLLGGIGVAAIGKAIQAASEFSGVMAPIEAIMRSNAEATGDLVASMEDLRDVSMSMAAQGIFGTKENSEALLALAQAGLKTQEVFTAFPKVLEFAAAGNLKMEQAVRSSISTMTAFGMKVGELEQITKTMSSAALLTNANVEDMSEAFKHVGPVAAIAGISLEETAAAVGLLSQAGIRGSMAGTGLKRSISELVAPTGKAIQLLKSLGIEAVNPLTHQIRPLTEIVKQFEDAFTRLGPTADKTGIIMQIFGMRAGPAMAALISQGSSAIGDLQDKMQKSADQTAEITKKRAESLEGMFKRIGQALNNLRIAMGSITDIPLFKVPMEMLINFIEMLRKVTEKSSLAKFLAGLTIGFVGLASAIMVVAGGLTFFVSSLASVAALLVQFRKEGTGVRGILSEIMVMFSGGGLALKKYGGEVQQLTRSIRDMNLIIRAMPLEEKLARDSTAALTAAELALVNAARQVTNAYELENLQIRLSAAEKEVLAATSIQERENRQKVVIAIKEEIANIEVLNAVVVEQTAKERALAEAENAETAALKANTVATDANTAAKKRNVVGRPPTTAPKGPQTAAPLATAGETAGKLGWWAGLRGMLGFGGAAGKAAGEVGKATNAVTKLGKALGWLKKLTPGAILANIFGGPVGWAIDIAMLAWLIKDIVGFVAPWLKKGEAISEQIAKLENFKDKFQLGQKAPSPKEIMLLGASGQEKYKNEIDNYVLYWETAIEKAKSHIETLRNTTYFVPAAAEEDLRIAEKRLAIGYMMQRSYEQAIKSQEQLNKVSKERLVELSQTILGKTEGIEGAKGQLADFLKSVDDIVSAYRELRELDIELKQQQAATAVALGNSIEDAGKAYTSVVERFHENYSMIRDTLDPTEVDKYRQSMTQLATGFASYYQSRISQADEAFRVETSYQNETVRLIKDENRAKLDAIKTYITGVIGQLEKLEEVSGPEASRDQDTLDAKKLVYNEGLKAAEGYYRKLINLEKRYQLDSSKIQDSINRRIEEGRKMLREADQPPSGIFRLLDPDESRGLGLFDTLRTARRNWDEFYNQLDKRNQYARAGLFELAEDAQKSADAARGNLTVLKSNLIDLAFSKGSGWLKEQLRLQTNMGKETRSWLDTLEDLARLTPNQRESKILEMVKEIERVERRSAESAADVDKQRLAAAENIRTANIESARQLEQLMARIRQELQRLGDTEGISALGAPSEESRVYAKELQQLLVDFEKLAQGGKTLKIMTPEQKKQAEDLIVKIGKTLEGKEAPAWLKPETDALKATRDYREKTVSTIESAQLKSIDTVAKAEENATESWLKGRLAAVKTLAAAQGGGKGPTAPQPPTATARQVTTPNADFGKRGIPRETAFDELENMSIEGMKVYSKLTLAVGTHQEAADRLKKWGDAELATLKSERPNFTTDLRIKNVENIVNELTSIFQKFSGRVSTPANQLGQAEPPGYREALAEIAKAKPSFDNLSAKVDSATADTVNSLNSFSKGVQYSAAALDAIARYKAQPAGATGPAPSLVSVKVDDATVIKLKSEIESGLASGATEFVQNAAGAWTNIPTQSIGEQIAEGFAQKAEQRFSFERNAPAGGRQPQPVTISPQDSARLTEIKAEIATLRQALTNPNTTTSDYKLQGHIALLEAESRSIMAKYQEIGTRVTSSIKESMGSVTRAIDLTSDSVAAAGTNLALAIQQAAAAVSAQKFFSASPTQKRTGGPIDGYGGGDIIPAMLEPGEFVLRKEAVKKYGAHRIHDINKGRIPKFQEGGLVSEKKKKWYERNGAIDSAVRSYLMPAAMPLEARLDIDSINVLNNAAKAIELAVYDAFTNPLGSIEGMAQLLVGGYNKIVPKQFKVPGQDSAEAAFESAFKVPSLKELYANPLGPAMAVGLVGGALTGAGGLKPATSVSALRTAIEEAVTKTVEPVMNERGAVQLGAEIFGKDNRPTLIAKELSNASKAGLTKFDLSVIPTEKGPGNPAYEIVGGRSLNDLTKLNYGQEAAVFVPKITDVGKTPATVTKIPYPKANAPIASSAAEMEARYQSTVKEFLSRDRVVGGGTMKHIGFYEAEGQKIPIFEQKYFEGRPASEMMVDKYMDEKGFVKSPKGPGAKWQYERVEGDNLRVVGDLVGGATEDLARSKNVLFTSQGTIEVVDSMMKLLKKAQVDALRASGKIPGFSSGGQVGAGYGGGDTVPAMLEPGEYVNDKQTVRFFGVDFFERLKKFKFTPSVAAPKVQYVNGAPRIAMAAGGLVPNSPMHNLSITVQNKTFKVQGEENQIKGLMKALERERLTTVGS